MGALGLLCDSGRVVTARRERGLYGVVCGRGKAGKENPAKLAPRGAERVRRGGALGRFALVGRNAEPGNEDVCGFNGRLAESFRE